MLDQVNCSESDLQEYRYEAIDLLMTRWKFTNRFEASNYNDNIISNDDLFYLWKIRSFLFPKLKIDLIHDSNVKEFIRLIQVQRNCKLKAKEKYEKEYGQADSSATWNIKQLCRMFIDNLLQNDSFSMISIKHQGWFKYFNKEANRISRLIKH